jgi:hypothetical protein
VVPKETTGTISWTIERPVSDVHYEIAYTAWPYVPADLTERGYCRGTPEEPAHAEITAIRPRSLTVELLHPGEGEKTQVTTIQLVGHDIVVQREWIEAFIEMDEALEHRILDSCLQDADVESQR